ncbi:hypothetical protein MOKP126_50140 [Mycobacterium avium subsp. hominissuis]
MTFFQDSVSCTQLSPSHMDNPLGESPPRHAEDNWISYQIHLLGSAP